jgi:hypothetical protein
LERRSESEKGREREKADSRGRSPARKGSDKAIGQQGRKGLNTNKTGNATHPSAEKFQRPGRDFRGGGL